MTIKLSIYAAFSLAAVFAVISACIGLSIRNGQNMTRIVKLVFLACAALSISLSCLTAYMLWIAVQ